MTEVSIVVPTYANASDLSALLASIERQTVRPRHIIVVDNNSADGYPAVLARRSTRVEVVRLSTNTFFAKATDIGVRRCRTDFVAVINDDVVLDDDWVEVASSQLAAAPTAGSLASRIRQARNPSLLDSTGDHITADGRAGKIGYGRPVADTALRREWVTSASGTCALYRRHLYIQAGGFAHSFRAYLEDVDLGLRLQMLGFGCIYEPDATLSHVGGATAKPRISALRLTERNLARVVIRTFPPAELRASARRQLRGPAELLEGPSLRAWALGKGLAAAELPRLLHQRRVLRAQQQVSDDRLSHVLSRDFHFVGHL